MSEKSCFAGNKACDVPAWWEGRWPSLSRTARAGVMQEVASCGVLPQDVAAIQALYTSLDAGALGRLLATGPKSPPGPAVSLSFERLQRLRRVERRMDRSVMKRTKEVPRRSRLVDATLLKLFPVGAHLCGATPDGFTGQWLCQLVVHLVEVGERFHAPAAGPGCARVPPPLRRSGTGRLPSRSALPRRHNGCRACRARAMLLNKLLHISASLDRPQPFQLQPVKTYLRGWSPRQLGTLVLIANTHGSPSVVPVLESFAERGGRET